MSTARRLFSPLGVRLLRRAGSGVWRLIVIERQLPRPVAGGITGTGAISDAAETAAAIAVARVAGAGTVADGAEAAAGSGAAVVGGGGTVAEAAETIAAGGAARVAGAGTLADGAEVAAGSGVGIVAGSGGRRRRCRDGVREW